MIGSVAIVNNHYISKISHISEHPTCYSFEPIFRIYTRSLCSWRYFVSPKLGRTLAGASLVIVVLSFCAVTCVHADSSPAIIAADGKTIASVFDGLAPSWFGRQEVIQQLQRRHPANVWHGKLSSNLPIFGARVVQAQCIGCPPTEACSGSFTRLIPLPPGVGCDNPIACPSVNNFQIDPTDPSLRNLGEQNSYCGPSCCVDAEIC
jgi:hypothetical protein